MATTEQIAVDVREVTDKEIAAFDENGWARLPRLISPELAGELLRLAKERMGEQGDSHDPGGSINRRGTSFFESYFLIDQDFELFRALRTNSQLGRNAALLFGRDMGIRSFTNLLAVKLPRDLKTDAIGKGVTDWHQDFGFIPVSGNALGFWIALDEITPEMGPMQFYSGSHKQGLIIPPGRAGKVRPEDWPRLRNSPLSEKDHWQPGDATVHSALCVHGTEANTSDRARWGYIVTCFPADAPYVPYPSPYTDDIADELTPGEPLDHAKFPLLYSPDS